MDASVLLPSALPDVGCMATPRQPAIKMAPDEEAIPIARVPFAEAFATQWRTDAHCITYMPRGRPGLDYYRFTKTSLVPLRARNIDLVSTMAAFDFDLPNKDIWTPNRWEVFLSLLEGAAEEWSLAGDWTVLYRTLHGTRLVYVYDMPLPVERHEETYEWMLDKFSSVCGLDFDRACVDWTRLFRLPWVIREGVGKTWDEPSYIRQEMRVPVELLGRTVRARQAHYAELHKIDEEQPDAEEVERLLNQGEVSEQTGQFLKPLWLKQARKILHNRESYPCLFEGQTLALLGYRDTTLFSYVGQVVSLLFGNELVSVRHIYALFHPAVMKLEDDPENGPWERILWDMCCRLWAKEDAKRRGEESLEAAKQKVVESSVDQIIRGMKQWCRHPQLLSTDPQERFEFLRRHFIVRQGKSYWPMTSTGYYLNISMDAGAVISYIRSNKFEEIVPTKKVTARDIIDKPIIEIINENTVEVLCTVIGQSNPKFVGGYLENLDEDEKRSLKVSCYRLNPKLTPRRDAMVEAWLEAFWGEHLERGLQWIAHSLDFSQTICAMSVVGAPGIGKKLFVQGLAECLETPIFAGSEELTGQWQYNLLRTPFLVIEEGLPNTQENVSARFRQYVSSGSATLICHRKFAAPVQLSNPIRIIATANNDDTILGLIRGRSLDPDDCTAIAKRLIHVDLGEGGEKFLAGRGGMTLTGRDGHRWIAGDAGQPSDYVVARHFLWLHKNREPIDAVRFLVEGSVDSKIMQLFRTRSTGTPLVVETIVQMLNSRVQRDGLDVDLETGRLGVLAVEILDFWRKHFMEFGRSENLNHTSVAASLRGLCHKESRKTMRAHAPPGKRKKRWWAVDVLLLQAEAKDAGWECETLDKLVEVYSERKKAGRWVGETVEHNPV